MPLDCPHLENWPPTPSGPNGTTRVQTLYAAARQANPDVVLP